MAGNIKIIELRENYQKVAKSIIFNEKVDALTLGIYVKILGLEEKGDLNVPELAKVLHVSEHKIKTALSILERSGYVKNASGHCTKTRKEE